jgi:hypothetical protein
MRVVAPHARSFCLFLKRYPIPLSNDFSEFISGLCIHFLDNGIAEAKLRFTAQLWRTWLTSNNLPGQYHTYAEDDQTLYIQPPILPPWLAGSRHTSSTATASTQSIYLPIYDEIWRSVRDGLSLSVMGSSWHGIREDIFTLVRSLQGDLYSDADIRDIVNEIDKGGASGLQSAVVQAFRDENFKSEVMDIIGRVTLDEITELISNIVPDEFTRTSQDQINSAVSGAFPIFDVRNISGDCGKLRGSPQR